MNIHRILAFTGALVASTATFAEGGTPPSADYLKYRCIVLGEQSACSWNSKHADGAVPGPYAKYLIDRGVARDEALTAAKAIGEEPVSVKPTLR